jgi:hypothetical protein
MTATEFDKRITANLEALRAHLTQLEQQQAEMDDLSVAVSAEAISKLANAIMHDAIGNERAIGRTWQQIGEHFGVTRQSAHERFGKTSTNTGAGEDDEMGAE